jgi:hypothetical protein
LNAARAYELLSAATETVVTAQGPTRSVNACRALAALTGASACSN